MTRGDQLWDYLYIEDAIDAIISVMNTPSANGVFNLGSGRAIPLKKIAEKIATLAGDSSLLGLGDIPYRPDQVMHLQADITRLQNATGWQPRIGIEEGLRRTIAWHKEKVLHAAED